MLYYLSVLTLDMFLTSIYFISPEEEKSNKLKNVSKNDFINE